MIREQRFRWILRAFFLALIAAALFYFVDWRAALDALVGINITFAIMAFLMLSAQIVLSALRWQLTAKQLDIHFDPRFAVREYYLAQILNQTLPGGILGDAGRAYRSRSERGVLASGQAVLIERLAGQLGLLAVFAVGVAAAFTSGIAQKWPDWFTRVSLAMLGLLLLAALTATITSRSLKDTPSSSLLRKTLLDQSVFARQVAYSSATGVLNVAAFAACAAAVGATMAVADAATIIPIILFAMVLPLTISGWGFREGAAAALFPVVGLTPAVGVASSVVFGVLVFLSTTPALLFALKQREKPDPKRG
ncbi:MAG: lysylphosphatidylglycerol synthase transmembrane domain-containing protein [Pseudomonadota bacterium]